jgi:hypothetical protein
MHVTISEVLDKEKFKSKFKIVSVDKEDKYKSAKEFRFIVKTDSESPYDKKKFQILLLAMYKGYEKLNNTEHHFNIKEKMTNEWILKTILENTVVKKEIKNEKRNKI